MSFYGNVFYELADAISRIVVQNNGKDNSTFITPSDEPIEVPVIGLDGKMIMDSGNKWIQLEGAPNRHICSIYHAERDENNVDNSLLTFAKADEPANPIELAPGDYLQGTKFYYDDAGHIAGNETIYYKLPVSETELDLIDIKDRLGKVEESDGSQGVTIGEHTVAIGELEKADEDIAKDVTDLTDLVGNKVFMTTEDISITQAIGNLNNMKAATDDATISGSIVALSNKLGGQSASIENLGFVLRAVVENLCVQIEEQGMTIDRNRLWEGANATS